MVNEPYLVDRELPPDEPTLEIVCPEGCQKCLEASSLGEANIHYGQTQKLINMSLKYLYNEFAAYYPNQNRFRFPENNVEYLFHLPIDRQSRSRLVGHHHFNDLTSSPWSR